MNVGQRVIRADGVAKATGRAVYVDDIVRPGMLYGKTVRSPAQYGAISAIDFDARFDWSSVTVVGAADIPGKNAVALLIDDQPVLAEKEVRHLHEPILLVAAEDPYRATAAVNAIKVHVETRTPVDGMDAALAAKTKVFGETNIFKEITIEKGDIEAGFAASPVIVEEIYDTGAQEQLYIEPQGMLAEPMPGGGIVVTGSMQCPYYVHRALKTALGIDDDRRVRVIQAETGGGFGGKEEYPSVIAVHAALLAMKTGRPVKIVYDRDEDMAATPKRHPAELVYRAGVARDGRLLAMDIDIVLDGGAYCTLSPVVLSRCVLHAMSAYRCPNVRIRGRAVATHTPPNGAFRGFGAPQSIFACELHMDAIARRLGLSPLDVRRKNLLLPGDTTSTGQVLDQSVSAAEVLEKVVLASGYSERHAAFQAAPRSAFAPRRGLGLALFMHGCGFTGSGETKLSGRIMVSLAPDANGPHGVTATVWTASTEIGQGMRTIFGQIASDALGLPYEAVHVAPQDTALVPDSGPTVASRTCMIVGGVLERTARALAERLRAGRPDVSLADAVRAAAAEGQDLSATGVYKSPPNIDWDEEHYRGSAYPAYGFGAIVVEVETCPVSFETRIVDVVTCQDVGKAIHPTIVEGQIEGGTAQALGYAAFEDVAIADGAMSNNRFSTYIIPTAVDLPDVRVILHENPYSGGPFGAKGVGEMPMDGPAPAFVAAVSQATGAVFQEIPLTPERIAERARRHFWPRRNETR